MINMVKLDSPVMALVLEAWAAFRLRISFLTFSEAVADVAAVLQALAVAKMWHTD
jgi:hypothetical protein